MECRSIYMIPDQRGQKATGYWRQKLSAEEKRSRYGKENSLGKGLGAIFGDEVMESAAEEQEMKNHKEQNIQLKYLKKRKLNRKLEKRCF